MYSFILLSIYIRLLYHDFKFLQTFYILIFKNKMGHITDRKNIRKNDNENVLLVMFHVKMEHLIYLPISDRGSHEENGFSFSKRTK